MGSFYGASGRASVFDRIRAKPRINDRDNNYCFLSSGYDILELNTFTEHKEDVHMNDRIVHLGMTLQLFETDCKDISL